MAAAADGGRHPDRPGVEVGWHPHPDHQGAGPATDAADRWFGRTLRQFRRRAGRANRPGKDYFVARGDVALTGSIFASAILWTAFETDRPVTY